MSIQQFQNEYTGFLNSEAESLKKEALQLVSESRSDEANFAKIKLNIVEIFTQMFTVSMQKSKNAPLPYIGLSEAYLAFFEKIPASWQVNLKKCQEHQMETEAHIEILKLEMAETLKTKFITLMSDYSHTDKEVQ